MNEILKRVSVCREKAAALRAEKRWAEATEAYAELAKAWIAAAGITTSPSARAERLAESDKAMEMAAECKLKAARQAKPAEDCASKRKGRVGSGGGANGEGVEMSDDDADNGDVEWPKDSLHAQLAGDKVGDMLIAQIEGSLRTTGVTWGDVGGQDGLVRDLKTILAQSVMLRPDGTKPDGAGNILMVGPPGTGKTFLVSALANSISGTGAFYDVSLSKIEGHLKGMTEKSIGLLYESARFRAPSLVFFDEVDCICTSRENGGGGVTLGAILAEMDGLKTKNSGKGVPPFVLTVAATNAPWSLDSALLSRFGGHIVLVGSADAEGRRQILEKHLRRYQLESTALLDWLSADLQTQGFSGRDIKNLVSNAVQTMQKEMNPGISTWESIDEIKGKVQNERPLTQRDFESAFKMVKASITPMVMNDFRLWMKDHAYKPVRGRGL